MSKLITFEGPDGCGKSTLSKAICESLKEQGVDVFWDTNPSYDTIGKLLREHLKENDLTPHAFLFLFLADRHDHFKNHVAPKLAAGQWVILDRYMDSTLAFQSLHCGMDVQTLSAWIHQLGWFRQPDRTYVLDLDFSEMTRRMQQRKQLSANDQAGEAFYQDIRQRYKTLADIESERIRLLDAQKEVAALVDEVLADLQPWIQERTS